ncbi:MAG: hypothetical protein V4696_07380 [Pseudomonadota bacterium]
MTDSLAKPANLPEPHYTPEKGGWRAWAGGDRSPDDWAGRRADDKSVWLRKGSYGFGNRWTHRDSPGDIIAYLAKPACICDVYECGVAKRLDCPACNRVGEGICPPLPIAEAIERDCPRCAALNEAPKMLTEQDPFEDEDAEAEEMLRPALECWQMAGNAFAAWMGDPDGKDDLHSANLAAAQIIHVFATPDLPTARATCEAAGWKVLEPKTKEGWRQWLTDQPEDNLPLSIDWGTWAALGLILPDDGET